MDGKTIVVSGKFPTLNQFIDANRRRRGNWSCGNDMKQRDQHTIAVYIHSQVKGRLKTPIYLHYHFFCANTKADKDNVAGYFHKIFQDALVSTGKIPDDAWKYITGWTDSFDVDKRSPRVEVRIEESN